MNRIKALYLVHPVILSEFYIANTETHLQNSAIIIQSGSPFSNPNYRRLNSKYSLFMVEHCAGITNDSFR